MSSLIILYCIFIRFLFLPIYEPVDLVGFSKLTHVIKRNIAPICATCCGSRVVIGSKSTGSYIEVFMEYGSA